MFIAQYIPQWKVNGEMILHYGQILCSFTKALTNADFTLIIWFTLTDGPVPTNHPELSRTEYNRI